MILLCSAVVSASSAEAVAGRRPAFAQAVLDVEPRQALEGAGGLGFRV